MIRANSFFGKAFKVKVLKLHLILAASTLPIFASQAQTIHTRDYKLKVETIARGLVHPWAIVFLPDNTMLVTERRGTLQWIQPNGQKISVDNVPPVTAGGQGGLMDIALDVKYISNNRIYLSFAEPRRNGTTGTSIASARFVKGTSPRIEMVRILFRQNNPTNSKVHFGSRIVTTSDNRIFFTIGDRGQSHRAQDPFDHAGSLLRINSDGSIPISNPFVAGKKGAKEIWSIGHRNPQGATLDRKTGKIWTVEHGAAGGDEVNTPAAGQNYGWPIISYGKHYSGAKIGVGTRLPGMEQPLWFWDPSIAPSGLTFYDGNQFPKWKGNLFVGALRGAMLVRLKIENGRITSEERLLKNRFGRIRDVRQGPGGKLYLLTDSKRGTLLQLRRSED